MNLLRGVSIFHSLGFPILVGNSRKRFIKDISKKMIAKQGSVEPWLLQYIF